MKRQSGFTLLELLVAVAIFAVVGAMAYSGLYQVLLQQEGTAERSERLADLQKAYRILQRDLEQVIDRGIRNEFGENVDALVGGSGFNGVEFSRAGYANPAGFLRSQIQRVAYVPDQDVLLRRTWRVLDRAQDSHPDEEVLVEGLRNFAMRFLGNDNEWQERWPSLQSEIDASESQGLPRAVEVQLELDDLGVLSWLFPLPEAFVAGAASAAADASGVAEQP
jgi:general secretion pathway protein J